MLGMSVGWHGLVRRVPRDPAAHGGAITDIGLAESPLKISLPIDARRSSRREGLRRHTQGRRGSRASGQHRPLEQDRRWPWDFGRADRDRQARAERPGPAGVECRHRTTPWSSRSRDPVCSQDRTLPRLSHARLATERAGDQDRAAPRCGRCPWGGPRAQASR